MFLCEVAVGSSACLTDSQYMESPVEHTTSTKGVGLNSPKRDDMVVTPEGVGVPMGKLTEKKDEDAFGIRLNYNEFIVYDTKRIAVRYIVEFQ